MLLYTMNSECINTVTVDRHIKIMYFSALNALICKNLKWVRVKKITENISSK